MESGDPRWSLTVGNIRGDMNAVLEALAAQSGIYTLETVTPQGVRKYETIRSIKKVVPWAADLNALVAAGAAPRCKNITLTETQGEYYPEAHPRPATAKTDAPPH